MLEEGDRLTEALIEKEKSLKNKKTRMARQGQHQGAVDKLTQ